MIKGEAESLSRDFLAFIQDHGVVDGEILIPYLAKAFGLTRSEVASVLGGLMARGLIYSPRLGKFKSTGGPEP